MQGKKRLFIIGAHGFGREIESWLDLTPPNQRDWYIAGYLDKDPDALENHQSDYEVVGYEDTFEFVSDDMVIMGITAPNLKELIYKKLQGKIQFFSYVAPGALIAKFVIIGEGTVISPNSIIAVNATMGKLVTVNCGSQIGHDVEVGDFSSIQSNVDIGGKCKLDNKVLIATGATIIPGRAINDNVMIGAGSVVVSHIKKSRTVFGIPAKKILLPNKEK